jgi:ribosome-associated protein
LAAGGYPAANERKGPLTTSIAANSEALSARAVPSHASVFQPRPGVAETLQIVLARLDDMKAEDTATIDLQGKSSLGDYMVVASGRSNRHVGAIADRVIEGLGHAGIPARVEGVPHCDWVLIDASDVIVHVFRPEVRAFYNLERMWSSGPGQRRAS